MSIQLPDVFCWQEMKDQLTGPFSNEDEVDRIMKYRSNFVEYGIPIHDGGSSYIVINYCPWCGTKLPDSKRDEWFAELEKTGFNSPYLDEIPEEYKDDRWYKKGGIG